jgi:hypothetical protein
MADDTTTEDKEKSKKGKKEERPPTVAPEPADPRLFAFIVKHCSPSSMPQVIELRQAWGPGGRNYGGVLTSHEFAHGVTPPSHSVMIELVNEFLDFAQNNCNELGKPTGYGVLLKNHLKSDQHYAVFYMKMRPTSRPVYDGEGDNGEIDGDVMSDAQRRDRLLAFSLKHMEEADLNERWRQEQHAKATGDIIGKYQEFVGTVTSTLLGVLKENRELVKQNDELASHKLERELAAKQAEFRMGMMHQGFNFLKQMVPVAVNQITGKQTIPTEQSSESIAVGSFLESLSKQQAEQLFGDMDAEGHPIGNGIFTPMQTQIFAGVAQCSVPPAELEQLMSGPTAVTESQIAKAQSVLSQQQMMPLFALIMSIKQKQQNESASPSTDNQ